MKGLTGSVGAVTVIALGLFPGANGNLLRQELADHGQTGSGDAGSPSMQFAGDNLSRRLQRRGAITDDALDPNGTVSAGGRTVCERFTGKRFVGEMPPAYKYVIRPVLCVVFSNHCNTIILEITAYVSPYSGAY